jgi:hypothetical protein
VRCVVRVEPVANNNGNNNDAPAGGRDASDEIDRARAAHDLVVLVELFEQLVELVVGELDGRAHLGGVVGDKWQVASGKWNGRARQSAAWRGMARHGAAWRGMARHGAWCGTVSRGRSSVRCFEKSAFIALAAASKRGLGGGGGGAGGGGGGGGGSGGALGAARPAAACASAWSHTARAAACAAADVFSLLGGTGGGAMPPPFGALPPPLAEVGARATVLELAAPGVPPPVAGETVAFQPRAAGDLDAALLGLAAAFCAW